MYIYIYIYIICSLSKKGKLQLRPDTTADYATFDVLTDLKTGVTQPLHQQLAFWPSAFNLPTMSNHGREDEFDDEVDEAAAAAQKQAFENLRSWTSWGSLKREPKARTERKGNENFSRFSGQWLGSDAPCVVKAECPVYTFGQPDRLTYHYIYRDKETTMKFDILGGKFSVGFVV